MDPTGKGVSVCVCPFIPGDWSKLTEKLIVRSIEKEKHRMGTRDDHPQIQPGFAHFRGSNPMISQKKRCPLFASHPEVMTSNENCLRLPKDRSCYSLCTCHWGIVETTARIIFCLSFFFGGRKPSEDFRFPHLCQVSRSPLSHRQDFN